MTSMSMRQMLEAGVHFGHQTRFWNPKMAPFIFGERNRIHIINLEKTLPLYVEAAGFVKHIVADGGRVLFVGTKRSAREAIAREATRCGMPYVSHRWLGGMLTNFKTIRQSIKRLAEIDDLAATGMLDQRSKREAQMVRREREKLERSLGGIKEMEGLPDVMFVVDVGHENIAIHEARKLGIPVVAIVDTNCSPDGISYVIPGNDDAMRAIELYAGGIADAVLEGRSTIPDVAVGEDEFVELDEEGKPRAKSRPEAPCRAGPQEDPRASQAGRLRCGCRARHRRGARRGRSRGEPGGVHGASRGGPQEGPDRGSGRCRGRSSGRRGGTRRSGRGELIMSVTAESVKALRERTGAGMMECKKALVEANGDLEAAAEAMRKSGLAKADKKAGRIAAEGVIAVERSADGLAVAVVEVNSETDFVAREKDFLSFAAAVAKAALESRASDLEALLAVKLPSGQTVDETRRALIARIGENIGVRRFEILTGTAPIATYLHGSRIGTVVVIEGGDAGIGHDIAMHVAAISPQFLSAEDVPADQVEKEREIFIAQAATDPKLQGKPKEVLVKATEGKLRKYLGEITLLGQPFVKDDKQTVAQVLKQANARVVRFVRYEVGAGIEKKQENFAAEVMAQVRGA